MLNVGSERHHLQVFSAVIFLITVAVIDAHAARHIADKRVHNEPMHQLMLPRFVAGG